MSNLRAFIAAAIVAAAPAFAQDAASPPPPPESAAQLNATFAPVVKRVAPAVDHGLYLVPRVIE